MSSAAGDELGWLTAAARQSAAAVVVVDVAGTVVAWNQGAEQLYGRLAGDVVGRPVSGLVPAEDLADLGSLLAEARGGGSLVEHRAVRWASEGPVEVALVVSPVRDGAGTVIGTAEVALERVAQAPGPLPADWGRDDLEAALAAARAADARSRRFVADAAHQLRTPVTGLHTCAEALLRGPEDTERDRLLAHVVREAHRAGELVSGLLKMARLDEGEPVAPERCDVVALCADEVDRAWALSPQLDIIVRVGRLPGPVLADPNVLREILANLLENASRHARQTIRVEVTAEAAMLQVRVVDDGPGVPPELESRMFDRFVSLDGRGGSGLGLPIARALARAHGGDLGYEVGAGFVLGVPLVPTGP